MLVFAFMITIGGVYAVCKSIEMKAAEESAKRRDEQSYERLKFLNDIYEAELEKKMMPQKEETVAPKFVNEEAEKDEEKTES